MKRTKQKAFTLAEVLITLGIIGVVAAMTMPTLMANTNAAKYKAQYKKTLATLNQVGMTAEAQYGFSWGSSRVNCHGASDDPETIYSWCAIFNKILVGEEYLGQTWDLKDSKGQSYPYPTAEASVNVAYLLADGSMIGIPGWSYGSCNEESSKFNCKGWIDVNGTAGPNKEVSCAGSTVNGICNVPNDATHMTDIYPIWFHDSVVEPLTPAAKSVLKSSK